MQWKVHGEMDTLAIVLLGMGSIADKYLKKSISAGQIKTD